jgi:hypothetical protein
VYGEYVSEGCKQFSKGRDKVESGSQSTTSKSDENIEKVTPFVQNDQHFTVRLTVEELNINRETVYLILMENMGLKKRTVPKNFINDQLK